MFRMLMVLTLVGAVVGCNASEDPTPVQPAADAGTDTLAGVDAVHVGADVVDAGGELGQDVALEADVAVLAGRLEVHPGSLSFEGVRIGQHKEKTLTLRNTGDGPLRIDAASVTQLYAPATAELGPGSPWLSGVVVLEPHTFRDITVRYEPSDHRTDQGFVSIQSNDSERQQLSIRIETINAYPDMQVPNWVQFGSVAPGSIERESLLIYNRGQEPLTISAIAYAGAGKFSLEFAPTRTLPALLERNGFFPFEIVYAPDSTAPDRGAVTITSNDPDDAEFEILLLGNGATPCILSAGDVDFGDVALETATVKAVALLNCSESQRLTISGIELTDDGAGTFALQALPTLPRNVETRQTALFEVVATLASEQEVVGTVRVTSNDPDSSPLDMRLRVRAAQR